MGEIIGVIGLLVGFALGIRGLYLFFVNKNKIKCVFGLEVSFKIVVIFSLFFTSILVLFLSLTYLNVLVGLVKVNASKNVESLGLGFFSNLSAAILEEFIFRVLLFYSLIEFIRNKATIVLAVSILFSFFHMPETMLAFLSYFLGGVMYGYSYLKFQNILVPIGIHFSWNYIQGAVFGYPVTGNLSEGFITLSIIPDIFFNGGDQGPESCFAGIVIRVLIILMIYIIPYKSINLKFLTQSVES